MSDVTTIDFKSIRDQLAGLVPMSTTSVYEFTPKLYDAIPEQYKPTFKIKQFTMSQADEIRTIMTGKKKLNDEKTTELFTTLLFNVFEGWTNLVDLGTGTPIVYDGNIETMKLLPQVVILKLFEEVLIISGIMTRDILATITELSAKSA